MRGQGWKSYLAVLLAAVAGRFFTDPASWTGIGWEVAIGYLSTAAILVGARRNLPGERTVWYCFALGIFGNTTGILVEAVITYQTGDGAFPSVADVFYLTLYPTLALGLALLIRKRTAQRDWGTLVDATTVTAGLGLLAWIYMIHPEASDPSIHLLGHIVSAAYPIGDVVLVGMTVRLQLSSGTRTPSFW